jgi:hypothetical protein
MCQQFRIWIFSTAEYADFADLTLIYCLILKNSFLNQRIQCIQRLINVIYGIAVNMLIMFVTHC